VDVLQVLDAAAVRRWSHLALDALEAHRDEIDRLNVFPIPDGDTGTNLVLTLRSGVDSLDAERTDDAARALRVFARGAVLGARGNSGVIVSQLLRSLADAALGVDRVDAAVVRAGLYRGASDAREVVADPVEGTILTVARAVADATRELPGDATLTAVATTAVTAAEDALGRTTEQLAVLADAGVVDAGSRGFVLILDALARAVDAEVPELPAATPPVHPMTGERETGSPEFVYEVQYLLAADAAAADALRDELATLGDSVVVVGTGEDVWNVHVHVNDVGAAIEAGVGAGRPSSIRVTRFTGDADAVRGGSAVVAVIDGSGIGKLFDAEGVHVLSDGTPSSGDVLAAVHGSGAGEVVVVANGVAAIEAAEAAARTARSDGLRVAVVPTRSPVQGLAAVAVHDAGRRFDDDVVAMAEAAAATRFAEIVVAQHEALTSAGMCRPGDVLGLIDGEVVEIGRGVSSVALALTDRLLGVGAELMTLLLGAGTDPDAGDTICRHIRARSPLTEVTIYDVGDAAAPLIVGVE